MDTQDFARSHAVLRERFYHADIQRREFERLDELFGKYKRRPTVAMVERFAGLAKAVQEKDRASADQILRMWGVRR